MNLEILLKIKSISLIFFSSLIALIITYGMYQTLDINASKLKNNTKDLQNELIRKKKETRKNILIANKNISFFNSHQNLFFIPVKNQFELIKFNNYIKNELKKHCPDLKINVKGKLTKTKIYLYQYLLILKWKYKNQYYLKQFFNYLNNNYFYNVKKLTYDTKRKEFTMKLYLYSKKSFKKILNKENIRKRYR